MNTRQYFIQCMFLVGLIPQQAVFGGQTTIFVTRTDQNGTPVLQENLKNSYSSSLNDLDSRMLPAKNTFTNSEIKKRLLERKYFTLLLDLNFSAETGLEICQNDIKEITEISQGIYRVSINQDLVQSLVAKIEDSDEIGIILEIGDYLFVLESVSAIEQNMILNLRSSDGQHVLLVLPLIN